MSTTTSCAVPSGSRGCDDLIFDARFLIMGASLRHRDQQRLAHSRLSALSMGIDTQCEGFTVDLLRAPRISYLRLSSRSWFESDVNHDNTSGLVKGAI